MPNGATKNWVRLCAAIDGFRSRYKCWPSRVLVDPVIYRSLKAIFVQGSFEKLTAQISLITEEGAQVVAVGDRGKRYDYGREGFPDNGPDIRAADWIGICPDSNLAED